MTSDVGTVLIRLKTNVNKWLSVHAGAMYSKRDKRYAYATNSTTADVWYYMFRWGPTFPWVDEDNGNPTGTPCTKRLLPIRPVV